MKRALRALATLLCVAAAAPLAAQTEAFSPQIPLLVEREDNILFAVRCEAQQGEIFDSLTVEFDASVDMRNVKSVKLYYGGIGNADAEKQWWPVHYIPRDTPGRTLRAQPSYSVLQSRVKRPSHRVTLTSGQRMTAGINYFWVSIELSRRTPLDARIAASVAGVSTDGHSTAVAMSPESCTERRVGVGVRHAGDDGAAAYRIPGLVTTVKGTLLGVYDVRRNNSADLQEKIDIGVSRSTDGGRTWQPMRRAMSFAGVNGLPDAQNGVGDPAILVDKVTGRVWIVAAWTHGLGNGRAWTCSGQGMAPEATGQLVMCYSDDDGRTWSKPQNVTPQVKDPSWYFLLQGPGRGITMHDGTLVFAAQYIDSERMPHATILWSRDRGETWHIGTGARSDTTESQVAEISDGVLMLNMRDNRGGSRAVSVTTDMGASWSEHPSNRSALQEPVCMASLLAVGADENVLGRDLLIFSNPNSTTRRNCITVKGSTDGGVTWPVKNGILLDTGDGWGYSCLTLVDPKTIGILYEGSAAHMTFQTVKIGELINE